MKIDKIAYNIKYKGFSVKACYLKENSKALIVIRKKGRFFRRFLFPAYKIWNIAAHFTDMVETELLKESQP